jgi:hypothetical protein
MGFRASTESKLKVCSKESTVRSQENMKKTGCPFAKLSGWGCTCEGSPSEIMDHVMSYHKPEMRENEGPFLVQLQNFSKYNNFHKAVHTMGKLFYLLWLIKGDIIHFLVFVVPDQTSEEYIYDMKLGKGRQQIEITGGACDSFWNYESTVLETSDITKLHRRTVKHFFKEDDTLSCVIEIRRKEAAPSHIEVHEECVNLLVPEFGEEWSDCPI